MRAANIILSVCIVASLTSTLVVRSDEFDPDSLVAAYVDVNITSNVPEARLIDASTGQILGTTPFVITYTKATYPFSGEVASLIIEREGYIPVAKVVVIDKWGRNRKEASERQNAFFFVLEPVGNTCRCDPNRESPGE